MVAHAQAPTETERPQSPVALWRHLFGEGAGYLCLFSGRRPAPGSKRLLDVAESYWPYPQSLAFAEQEAYQQDALGREVYCCAHLLRRKRRVKASAGPIDALWVDGDGAGIPTGVPQPSAVVESSPGRGQFFWRLTEPVEPAEAEALNRRLAYAIGADKGGWDLTQLLRVPGCTNHKYADGPTVALDYIRDAAAVDAAFVESLLPEPPAPVAPPTAAPVPDDIGDIEPPVRLGADGLAWWRGERVARKEDGSTDRSETLWGIACELWAAGASRGTLLAALAERDWALGHECFTARPGEYARIARKLAERGAEPTLSTVDTPPACPEWQGRAERAEAKLRAIHELMTCPGMTPVERVIAYGTVNEEESARSRGLVGEYRPEMTTVRPSAVGDNMHVGRQTVSATWKRWHERGYLQAEIVEDEETGTQATVVRLPARDQLSNLALASTWVRPPGAKHVGGAGNRCPKCGGTGVKKEVERATIETTTVTCATCDEVHSVTRRVVGQTSTLVSFELADEQGETPADWRDGEVDNGVAPEVDNVVVGGRPAWTQDTNVTLPWGGTGANVGGGGCALPTPENDFIPIVDNAVVRGVSTVDRPPVRAVGDD